MALATHVGLFWSLRVTRTVAGVAFILWSSSDSKIHVQEGRTEVFSPFARGDGAGTEFPGHRDRVSPSLCKESWAQPPRWPWASRGQERGIPCPGVCRGGG